MVTSKPKIETIYRAKINIFHDYCNLANVAPRFYKLARKHDTSLELWGVQYVVDGSKRENVEKVASLIADALARRRKARR